MSKSEPVDLLRFPVSSWLVVGFAFGLLVLVLLLRWLWRVRQERGGVVSAGEVVGVVGRPGSGKTLFAVRVAVERLRAGCEVRTNFTMTLPDDLAGRWAPFRGWDDLITLQDAVVVLDEAHLIAPSTVGVASLPQEARWYLSQVRRMGVQLYWVSQHEMRVAKTLRDLTNYIWVCNSYRGGRAFKATQYEPEHLRREGRHLEVRRWRWDPALAGVFDTWEILATGSAETAADVRIGELAAARNRNRRARAGSGTAEPSRPAVLSVRSAGDVMAASERGPVVDATARRGGGV